MAEMVLIYALNHGVWKMNEEGVPQICLSVPVETLDGKTENFEGCTAVPEEILYKWLSDTTLKV